MYSIMYMSEYCMKLYLCTIEILVSTNIYLNALPEPLLFDYMYS